MADINRGPPPDLFDNEDKDLSDEELEASTESADSDNVKVDETVEISLDSEEKKDEEPKDVQVEKEVAPNGEEKKGDEPEKDAQKPTIAADTKEESFEDSEKAPEEKTSESSEQKMAGGGENAKGEENHEDEDGLGETDEFDIDIKVSDPEKVGDGMGAFMQYQVKTTTSLPSFKKPETSVPRRFSDFLGLHGRLNAKFLVQGKVVPPAPEKSVLGMTKVKLGKEESTSADFVERRRASLERYLNRTAAHPDIREDSDFREFLEATSLPKATSTSALSGGGFKRLVKNVGDTMFHLTTKMSESDAWFEEKQLKIETLEQQLKKLHQALESLVGNRRELSTSTAIFSNSAAMLSSAEEHTALSRALSNLAEVEEKVDKIIQNQMDTDFYVLAELFKDYLGLVHAVKLCFHQRVRAFTSLQNAQQTLTKKREMLVKAELASKADKVKLGKEEVDEWEKKVEKCQEEFGEISKTLKGEFSRFERNRVKDFREAIIKYLQQLMENQQQILKYWEEFLPEAKEIA